MEKKNCVTFIWKISNLFKTDEYQISPEFYVNSLRESGWELELVIPPSMSKEIAINLKNTYYRQGPGLLYIDFELSVLAVNPSKTISIFRENTGFSMNGFSIIGGFPSWYTLTRTSKNEYFRDDTLTIQCKLWKKNLKYKDLTPLFYQAYSRIPIRKISFDWSLNFSSLQNSQILKRKFVLDKKQPTFNVETVSKQNRIGFEIEQENGDFDELQLACKISVLDASGNVSISRECYETLDLNDVFNFSPFISIKYLKENSKKYIKDNELNLVFEFTYEVDDDDVECYDVVESISKFPPKTNSLILSPTSPSVQPPSLNKQNILYRSTPNLFTPQKKTTSDACTSTDNDGDMITQVLKDDLHDMYLSNSWSDVVLEAEGRSFPCHKCILSARSPIFHSLLSESTTCTLYLELKASVLGSLLQFIYIGDIGIPMDFQKALELYEAATKYQIISLKNVCSKFLEDNLNEQNVCDTIVLASKLQDNSLKTNAEKFIFKRAANILQSDRWKDLVKNDAKYIVETMHRIYLGKERENSSSLLLTLEEGSAISADDEKSKVEHSLNFLSMYQSSMFSDFELSTKNGKMFAVHKDILWARSPVFKAMLSSNINESSTRTIDIPEMDEQMIEQFLCFLYSGNMEVTELEIISKLYFSADKFQISSLKDWCSKSLAAALSLKNVCEILILSDQYRDEKLKNEALDYLAKNDESVILSPEWKVFMETTPQLLPDTVFQIYARKKNLNPNNSEIESKKSPPSESTHQSEIDAATILQVDLVSLYEEKCFSDCKLRTEDKTFEVHKNILCARSPVFNAMFSSELEEATTNILVIPDIDGQTVDQMLRYIYTGTFEDSEGVDHCKLYYAADKYQINSLKDRCSRLLRGKLSTENVCEILLLANRHGDTSLEAAVKAFLTKNSKVFDSETWKTLMSNEPRVCCETMLAIY